MPLRVLVVDDSALMRKHLTRLFQGAGFDVGVARTGQEAVDQVLAFQPDVVSLDINMPGMDGLTALSLIMAARPTPVIMVSSLTTKGASTIWRHWRWAPSTMLPSLEELFRSPLKRWRKN